MNRVVLGLLAGAMLLLSASTAFARATEIQRNWQTGTGTVMPWWRVAVASGHLLIAGVTFDGGSGVTITPPAGWQPIGTTYRSNNGTTIGTAIYYIENCAAKALHTTETFTFSPATTVATVQLTEVAGILTTGSVDADSIATVAGTSASATLTAATAADETSEYGYVIFASTATAGTINNGTNGFARGTSYLYNTTTNPATYLNGTNHRTVSQSTLMTSAAGSALSTTITLTSAAHTGVMVAFKVQALYWIGGGSYPARPVNPSPPVAGVCYGYFDDDACWANSSGGVWSGTASPAANDVVVYDAGGLGDCTMNPWTPGTEQAYSIEVRSGYLGAIMKTGSDLQLQRHFTLMGGTFSGSAGLSFLTNQGSTAYNGDIDVAAGTFTSNGMTVNARALYVEGGTLNLTGSSMTLASLFNMTGGTATMGSATSVATTTTVLGGTLTFVSGTATLTGALTVRGSTAIFNAGATTMSVVGATIVDTAATFNANSATIAFTGTMTISSAAGSVGTLNASTSTLNFNNASASGANSFLIYPSGTLNGGTAHINFGANTLAGARSFRMTGGTAELSTATVTFNGLGDFYTNTNNPIVNFGSTALSFPGAFTATTGTITAGTGALTFSGAFSSGGTLNLTSAASLTFASTAAVTAGTTTVGSQTLSFPSSLAIAGTFNAGTGPVTVTGAYSCSGSCNANFTASSSLTFMSTFTITGGTTTFGSQTVTLPSYSQSNGTLNAGTSIVTVTGTTSTSGGLASFASTTTGPTFLGPITMAGGTITLGSGTVAVPSFTTTGNGTFNAGASHLTIAGAISMVAGNFNANTSTFVAQGTSTFAGTLPTTSSAFNGNTSTTTFSGPVVIGGSDGSRGQFHANAATISFEFPTTAMSPNSVLVQGAATSTFDVSTATAWANITFGKNTIAGTNAINLTTGTMLINSSTTTTFADLGEVTIGTGTTLTMGTNAVTFPNNVNLIGTLVGGNGALTFTRPLTVAGTFSGGSGARIFSSTLAVTGAYTSSSGAHTFSAAVTNNAGTLNLATAATPLTIGFGLSIGGGTTTIGAQVTSISALTLTSGAFGCGNATMNVVGDTNITGGVATLSNTSNTVTFSGNVNVGPGTLTGGAAASNNKPVVVTGTTTVTANGVVNAGASTNFRFNGPVVLGTVAAGSPGTFNGGTASTNFANTTTVQGGSTLNVGAATLVTFTGAFSLLGSSTFNGGTGFSTFVLAPTLTSGTFLVGTTAAAGRQTFQQSTTFPTGVTLQFPSSGGRLSLTTGRVLTLQGPVVAATTSGATLPKIDCNACTAVQSITVAFTSSSTLNIDGLEFNNSVATGVSIASGATYTLLKNLKFQTNVAAGAAGSTHLAITLGTATINMPGCYFDTTAASNLTLNGTAGQVRGARAILEYQSTAINGPGGGESRDADGDNAPGDANPGNNYGENVAAPFYGSVVQWSAASPTDTAGTAEGSPTAAFDWNTFANYGVYVGYKNIGGAGTADRIWLRNADGSAGYYFDVPDSSGDIIGAPYWQTANEVTLGLDVNGDGDQTDTSVHVLYVPTSGGHIIKLIDSGTSLARPPSGVWATDFTDSNVVSISSPLISDSTNVYFGGADATTTKIFGVQIASGGLEKALVKNIGSIGAVTAAMSWKRISGVVYLYVGSRATLGQAYIYRINVSPGAMVEATFSGVTTNVNGSVRVVGNLAYAVTDGGQLHALDATNFNVGGFVNVTGFPYQTAVAQPIQQPAWISRTSLAFFGDDSGRLYCVTSAGANQTGYPLAVTTAAITSSPLYLQDSGVVAMGAADGYVYFIDKRNASGNPALFNRYYVGAGRVSSVGYNESTSSYMVASSDGKLAFIAKSTVADPTSANE